MGSAAGVAAGASVQGLGAGAGSHLELLGGTSTQSTPLNEREMAILAFERQWWRFSGAKEQSIRAEFDMTPAVYHQVLSALLDDPRALEFDPILVRRLLRLRQARHQARIARRESR